MSLECTKVVDAIASGVGLDRGFVRDHRAECAECASRIALAEQIGPRLAREAHAAEINGGETADLLGELRSNIQRQMGVLGRWRSFGLSARVAVLGVLGALLVLSQYFNARADLQVYPHDRLGIALAAFALPMILAWVCALRALHSRPLPTWYLWALGVMVLVVHVALAALPEVHTGHSASVGGTGRELIPRALACFIYGSVFSLPVIVLGVASLRTGARLPGSLLVAIVAAASIGNAVLQLHCPLTNSAHLLLGHASIGIFFAVAAAAWIVLRR